MLLRAARFTTGYVRLVGQEPAPTKCVLMSTCEVLRKDMRDCTLTDKRDRWTVKLDVRGLGGHLNTTFRGWSATLASRVQLVISRLVLFLFFRWMFIGGLEFIPGALHGIEATFLAMSNLRKLRSSIFEVVWSRRQPVASVGAVLSVQDGPQGRDPAFGSGFV